MVAAAVGSGTVLVAYLLGVVVPIGRAVDDRALRWIERAGAGAQPLVHAVLAYLSPALVAVGVVLIVVREVRCGDRIGAVRAVVLVVGSEMLAQAMKVALPRPGGGTNTLPSGHVTMIAAFMVVLAATVGWRRGATVLGALVVAGSALGTMIIGWHHPSDTVAACGVVALCWAAVRLIGRVRLQPGPSRPPGPGPQRSIADHPTVRATRPMLVARPQPPAPRRGEPVPGPLRNPRPRRLPVSGGPVEPVTLPVSKTGSGRGERGPAAVRVVRRRADFDPARQ